MRIQIDGIGTKNKGAELMLYAILEQIEQRYPNSEIILNTRNGNPKEINTKLKLKKRFLLRLSNYIDIGFQKIGIPLLRLSTFYPEKGINVVFDASGFRFGDQWNQSDFYLKRQEQYFKLLKKENTTIILLPQAFGPFNTMFGKRSAQIINNYVDCIFAREKDSYNYLIEAGVNENKVTVCTDFTNIVKGESAINESEYICIIPNKKMITETRLSFQEYVLFISKIVRILLSKKKKVILLNHEDQGDLEICNKINEEVDNEIQIIDNKNAKEIKGIIGNSYAVISSRFHGVASSLCQAIPCLATSWSHKYKLLFKDYNLSDYIIHVGIDDEQLEYMINKVIETDKNNNLRSHLELKSNELKGDTKKMWSNIFARVDRS